MRIARKEVPRRELIGIEAEVADATNKDLKGIKGIIVGETKNTLVIEQDNKTKVLLKEHVTLNIKMDGNFVRIDGRMLLGRPDDRVKK
ncbi:ribonuclease P protein subunit [Candidatus Woesearchaeota archaeon]|nr:ribonuclease P protein subunit [Candidatus Woesearchaeota archaeon]